MKLKNLKIKLILLCGLFNENSNSSTLNTLLVTGVGVGATYYFHDKIKEKIVDPIKEKFSSQEEKKSISSEKNKNEELNQEEIKNLSNDKLKEEEEKIAKEKKELEEKELALKKEEEARLAKQKEEEARKDPEFIKKIKEITGNYISLTNISDESPSILKHEDKTKILETLNKITKIINRINYEIGEINNPEILNKKLIDYKEKYIEDKNTSSSLYELNLYELLAKYKKLLIEGRKELIKNVTYQSPNVQTNVNKILKNIDVYNNKLSLLSENIKAFEFKKLETEFFYYINKNLDNLKD